MDFTLRFAGGGVSCDTIVTPKLVPIQTAIRPASLPVVSKINRCDLVYKDQSVEAQVVNRFTLHPHQIPMSVIVVLSMYQVDDCMCNGDRSEASILDYCAGIVPGTKVQVP